MATWPSPDAVRAFLRDILHLTTTDGGGGYLIFGLPPAEAAVHPSDKNDVHEFYLMCDDVEALIAEIGKRGIACGPVQDEGWGLLTRVTLPGGGKLGIYEPRHARPKAMSVGEGRCEAPKTRDEGTITIGLRPGARRLRRRHQLRPPEFAGGGLRTADGGDSRPSSSVKSRC